MKRIFLGESSLSRRLLISIIGVVTLLGAISAGSVVASGRLTAGLVSLPGNAAVSRPSAARILDRTLASQSLGREMGYSVYLPPGYDSSADTRYPVLYMLHGLGGSQRSWQNDGLFQTATDLIQSGEISPMIIVTPEGERGYWIDQANNGPKYGSYVSKDLVATIDGNYRTIPMRKDRAIGGMSMGGHGALQLAMNNPDEFGVVGAHSVALRDQAQAFSFFGDKQYFEAHDPKSLCLKNPGAASRFVIWIDIGTKDSWFDAASAFHAQLQSENLPHLWHVYAGGHDDAYWTSHAADYLRFYNQAFASPASFFAQPG